jgi:MICOS complex subunit MIC60
LFLVFLDYAEPTRKPARPEYSAPAPAVPSPPISKPQPTAAPAASAPAKPAPSKPSPAKPAAQAVAATAATAIAVPKPVEELPRSVADIEHAVEVAATTAVKEYNKAIGILKDYSQEIKKIVDDSVERIDTTAWISLKNKTGAKESAVNTAEQLAAEAKQTIGEKKGKLLKNGR